MSGNVRAGSFEAVEGGVEKAAEAVEAAPGMDV